MMKKNGLILLISIFIFSKNVLCQTNEWQMTSALIKFKIKNAGFMVDGSFSAVESKIIFDVTKNYGNSIEATVDSKSINTTNSTRDKHLKKGEYLDVEKYPKIKMKATVFSKEKDTSYKGYFKITIKDKSKEMFIPFFFIEKDGKASLKGNFTINRRDFNVGESSIILSDSVHVFVEVNVSKK